MTGFQLTRPQSTTWTPARDSDATHDAESNGRHASPMRAKLTFRRMFYFGRHRSLDY